MQQSNSIQFNILYVHTSTTTGVPNRYERIEPLNPSDDIHTCKFVLDLLVNVQIFIGCKFVNFCRIVTWARGK
jgi:hypothetical protein